MNVQAIINNMSNVIADIINNKTTDLPVYRVLQYKDTHKRIIELAFALGEDRLLRHINHISFKDFPFDNEFGCCIRCHSSILISDFYKEIYKELVGKDEYIVDIIAYGDVKVYIDLTHEELTGGYKFIYYIPMINFITPDKILAITRGEVTTVRPSGYKEIKISNI